MSCVHIFETSKGELIASILYYFVINHWCSIVSFLEETVKKGYIYIYIHPYLLLKSWGIERELIKIIFQNKQLVEDNGYWYMHIVIIFVRVYDFDFLNINFFITKWPQYIRYFSLLLKWHESSLCKTGKIIFGISAHGYIS